MSEMFDFAVWQIFYLVSEIFSNLFKGKFYLEDPSGTVQLDMSKAISFNLFVGACQQKVLYVVQ